MRGRIDRRTWLIRRRVDLLRKPLRALVRNPAALPAAFVCGLLAGRLSISSIYCAYGVLTSLVNQVKPVSSDTR